jgi:hypothetical protein
MMLLPYNKDGQFASQRRKDAEAATKKKGTGHSINDQKRGTSHRGMQSGNPKNAENLQNFTSALFTSCETLLLE